MILVREAMMEEWGVLRDVQLEALRDAPDAFGSTYAEQVALRETDWRSRVSSGVTFLAYVSEESAIEPAGLVGGLEEKQGTVELMSMWVRPHVRGHGVGEALVAAVVNWAGARHARSVHLWVFETNKYARMLYERCEFSPTGERQPLPSRPSLLEIGMTRNL